MGIEDFGQKPPAIVFKGKDPLHTKHSLFVLPIYLDCVGFICSFSIERDILHKVVRWHFSCLLKLSKMHFKTLQAMSLLRSHRLISDSPQIFL